MTHPRQTVVRAHITQDKWGLWMISLELPDGELSLATFGVDDPTHDIESAYSPEEHNLPKDTEYHISLPQRPVDMDSPDIEKPQPKRATAPYYVVKNGKKIEEVHG